MGTGGRLSDSLARVHLIQQSVLSQSVSHLQASSASVKDLDAPADINSITFNMGLILYCIEIKAERLVNNSGAGLKNAD